MPFGYLWFRLIDNLRIEWSTNPQYGYGWLVPVLCLGMILRKWQALPEVGSQNPEVSSARPVVRGQSSIFRLPSLILLCFSLLALLYLPVRLLEAATPEWRPIQWLLGIITVGLTLCFIYLSKGPSGLVRLAFPVAFFFVAIPWPTLVEAPVIQTLTRVSAAIVIEVLGIIGVPAIAHGNVIEVSSGIVGINEACSGIRSFQSSLMISLFLGEFFGLHRWRRLLLIPLGFALSLAFNVCRMSILTFLAAKEGVGAIAQYHDQAGLTITILCTLGLWVAAWWLSKKTPQPASSQAATPNPQFSTLPSSEAAVRRVDNHQPSILNRLSLCLIAWLVVVEAGVQFWYHSREARIKPGAEWSLNFPTNNPTLKDLPIDADTESLLRFDEGKQAAWQESDGTRWQGFYFDWRPGRVAGYLAKRHTPEICLAATGLTMRSGPELSMSKVHGVELPIRSYVFEVGGEVIHVFHCRWEAGVEASAYVEKESARFNLLRGIWAGRGNKGQKVLEFVLFGIDDPEQAKQALVGQLDKLIKVQKSKAAY